MTTYQLIAGSIPLLISLPHHGTALPAALVPRLTAAAQLVPDTDWHVGQLYHFARKLGASLLIPRYSRYVVDLNRPADGAPLYPGQKETGLIPLISFDETPLYRAGCEPDAAEQTARIATFWQPYHAALRRELDRLHAAHGNVLLWEGHSIRSQVPMFFDGTLADFNLGSAAGRSAASSLTAAVSAVLQSQQDYTVAINGRFKGGYITRHYGQPEQGIHALQLELSQHTYMEEAAPYFYRPTRAQSAAALIEKMLRAALGALSA